MNKKILLTDLRDLFWEVGRQDKDYVKAYLEAEKLVEFFLKDKTKVSRGSLPEEDDNEFSN